VDSNAEDKFREFVAARSMALIRTAYVLTGDQQHAEDLVQTALTKLAARWHKVTDPEAYTRRILYHEQVSWWRRKRVGEHAVPDPPDRGLADGSGEVIDRLDVRRALFRLAPRQRAVLVLRFYEDMSERQIAELLGCGVGTVRSQTSRGLARLRQLAPELSDSFPATPPMTEGALP
jgi:RNA polymerase sigma-70 factor (sigma-E family)